MAIEDIILRTVTHSPLTTKNATLTWEEEDNNWIEVFDKLLALSTVDTSLFEPYNPATTYEQGDYVSSGGNIWRFINVTPTAGITPGSDVLYWEIASTGEFAHEKNKDQYLDFGGTYQVSAADIFNYINTDLSGDYFFNGGNAFGADAVLQTIDEFDLIFGTHDIDRGRITKTGNWILNTKLLVGDTDESLLNTNDCVIVGSGSSSTTSAAKFYNSDIGTPLFDIRNDGSVRLSLGLYTDSGAVFFDVPNRSMYNTSNIPVVAANEYALYPNISFWSLNWLSRQCADSANELRLDWEALELLGDWSVIDGDFKISGTGNVIIMPDIDSPGNYVKLGYGSLTGWQVIP